MNPPERIHGKSYAAQGLTLPINSTPQGKIPTRQVNWLSPRFEPQNISATAAMSDINSAIRQAENGDPTSLFRFYRDTLLGDDHIAGEFDKRKLAVLGQPFSILPEDKNNLEDIKAAAACLRAIADCENWNDGIKSWLNSSLWPVSMVESLYRPADPRPVTLPDGKGSVVLQFTFKRMEPVNPMLFCYRHAYFIGGVGLGTATPIQQVQLGDINPNNPYNIDLESFEPFLRLWPIDDSGRIIYDAARASVLDPLRHIVHRGHLLTDQRDNWGGPFRSLIPWWLLRILGRDWFASFMEKYGAPFPVGKTNVEDEQAVALLQSAFSMAVKIGGLVIDQNDYVELKESAVQGGADGHRNFHEVCNAALSRRIIGQDLSASAKGTGLGSGVANLQANVREDIRVFDQQQLAVTLKRQLFANFLKFNGLPGQIQCVWGGLSDDDAKTFATLLKTLSDSGWEPTDEAVPTLQERFGIPVQRKASPVAMNPGGNFDPNSPTPYSAGVTILARAQHPADVIAQKKAAALSVAFKGRYSFIRQIILSASSAAEAQEQIAKRLPELPPGAVADIVEEGMQLAAAAAAK